MATRFRPADDRIHSSVCLLCFTFMAESKTIVLAGGGTGGHLYPGVAVAESLRRRMTDVRILFLCTQREIDKMILTPTGFEFIPQPIVPPATSISGLLKFWRAWRETKDMLRAMFKNERVAAAVGLGGFAAGAAIRMAASRKIPCALLNPDVIPGKANQFLMSSVQAVCCQFELTSEYISAANRPKMKMTGCPIRAELRQLPPREAAANRLSLDPMLKTLVITGASLGAQTVNEAAVRMLSGMTLDGWQVLHLAGREHAATVREADIGARVIDFTPAMADVWAVADLAISRSGASSCAELTACGIPSILMPYPFHKDMHQRLNAQVLAGAGAAVRLKDHKDPVRNAAKLKPIVEPLLHDGARRRAMSDAARKLGKPDAADRVADVIGEILASGR
jgi:UDP-N-acetylglucosamine--N-acetylmuramyl-(pentapeptide) pyrophosphoryl-undecaprenol N-acetylglucosamine transferase